MKGMRIVAYAGALAVGLPASLTWPQPPVGTAFTYQGQLKEGGVPVSDTCDFGFALWGAVSGGSQAGPTLTFDGQGGNPSPIGVANGLFTVELDFGASAFALQARWLEVSVACPAGAGVFTTLTPRQKLTPVPYAVQTRGLHVDDDGNVGIGTTAPGATLDIAGDSIRLFDSDSVFLTAYATGASSRAWLSLVAQTPAPAGREWRITNNGPRGGVLSFTDIVAGTERMVIDSDGNVGIGTTNPQDPLHVVGDITADGGSLRSVNPNNPSAKVFLGWGQDAALNDVARIRVGGDGAGAGNGLDIQRVSDVSLMRILHNGNVGIGTSSPNSALEVAGTVHSTSGGFKFPDGSVQATAGGASLWTPTGDDIFYTAGSVGIGTEGPFLPSGGSSGSLDTMSATLPSVRDSLACAADPVTGKIYCFGGWDGANFFDEIVEYDPATDTRTTMFARLPTPAYGLACAADPATGKIYCFGGLGAVGGEVDGIVEYDPATDTVVTMSATLPSGRFHLACVADPATGKIYCFGGFAIPVLLGEIVEYDPGTDTRTTMSATLPSGRLGLACVADPATGKIYCFGGMGGVTNFDGIVEYNPSTDTVVALSGRLPTPRRELACAYSAVTGKIYCFGGVGPGNLDEIVEYDPVTDAAVTMTPTLPSGRYGLGCAADPTTGKIYCFGGREDAARFYDILQFNPGGTLTLLQVGDPGDGTGAVANTWSVFSSRAFKRDIAPLHAADYRDILDRLDRTDVVRFRYSADARQTPHLGLIAEDAPRDIVSPGGQTISLADYNAFLMAAIKAQQHQLDERDCLLDLVQEQLADTQARVKMLEITLLETRGCEEGGAR